LLRAVPYQRDENGNYPMGVRFNDDGRGNVEFVADGENVLVIDQDYKKHFLRKSPPNMFLFKNPDLQRKFSNKLKTRILKDEVTEFYHSEDEYDEHTKLVIESRLENHPDKSAYDFDAFLLMHPDYVIIPNNNELENK